MTSFARLLVAPLVAAALLAPVSSSAQPNQSPSRPQPPGQATPANQSPAAPGNQPPAAPTPPAGIPIYISPGIVQHIQTKLLSLGLPVPTVSGAWGENSSTAVTKFQVKQGLDPGGDLDELTLAALDLSQTLRGDLPVGADAPVNVGATGSGAPLYASPRLTRLVQSTLTENGFPTDNVLGIWLPGSETAVRNYQKAKNLDITGSLDLRLIHALGLTSSLTDPKPGKLPTDSVAQILSDRAVGFTGAPLTIGPAGIRQIQLALVKRGFREVAVDGKWTDQAAASLKKFQESQKLEPTGSIDLRTLRALGFANPLAELDQGPPAPAKPPTKD